MPQLVSRIQEGKLDVYQILNEFVIFLDKIGKKPASIKLWITAIKGYLRHTGIKIYSEDFKQVVRLPKRAHSRENPLTKEILVRLLRNLPPKLQTVVLVATASGMRIGEIAQLKISDIDFDSKPTRIPIRSEITKTRESRETYLTTEATTALKDYLSRNFGWKEKGDNESIQDKVFFGRTSMFNCRKKDDELKNPHYMITKSVLTSSLLTHVRKVPELSRFNENGRNMIHFHAFRKFFRTTVGDAVGRDYAEALMGHHFYLDTYYNLPEEKKRKTYLKAEPYLTISDFAKIEKDMERMTEKQKEIERDYYHLLSFLGKNSIPVPETLLKKGGS